MRPLSMSLTVATSPAYKTVAAIIIAALISVLLVTMAAVHQAYLGKQVGTVGTTTQHLSKLQFKYKHIFD